MTSPDQILLRLQTEKCTAAALGDALRLPFLVSRAMCQRLEKDGLVTHEHIAGVLPVWSLTPAGLTRAATLNPTA
jgi:hypothetical protein